MSPRARLQLRQKMPNVRLHGLLGEEEALTDVAVDEAVRDKLEDLDLARCRLLLELPDGSLERNDLRAAARTPCRDFLKAARMVHVAAENLLALCGVHGLAYRRPNAGSLGADPSFGWSERGNRDSPKWG